VAEDLGCGFASRTGSLHAWWSRVTSAASTSAPSGGSHPHAQGSSHRSPGAGGSTPARSPPAGTGRRPSDRCSSWRMADQGAAPTETTDPAGGTIAPVATTAGASVSTRPSRPCRARRCTRARRPRREFSRPRAYASQRTWPAPPTVIGVASGCSWFVIRSSKNPRSRLSWRGEFGDVSHGAEAPPPVG
jgi:hypothetical protein